MVSCESGTDPVLAITNAPDANPDCTPWRESSIMTVFSGSTPSRLIMARYGSGWGRDEMAGYYYWGGKTDLETELKSSGYGVYTVSVGPISPNWDRAIEAFYQIKGGQVDYGNEKAEIFNIITNR